VEVKDDGRSFDVQGVLSNKKNNRLGLLGMRERVEMVGGRFAIESSRGQGTTIRADVPHGSDTEV
jgi:signal transduction histidine kinase